MVITGMALMSNEQPSLAQAAAMIDVAVEAADRFFPAFDFLLRGAKDGALALSMKALWLAMAANPIMVAILAISAIIASVIILALVAWVSLLK